MGWPSLRPRVIELSVVSFAVFVTAAMLSYPGGTFYEPERVGHSFWHNFLCDLLRERSISGAPNELGAILSTTGMMCLIPGLVSLVWLVPEVVQVGGAFMVALRGVAIASCLALAAIPLLPADRFGTLHAFAVVGAGIPATLALGVLVSSLALDRRTGTTMRALSALVVIVIALSLVVYARETFFAAEPWTALPSLSRLASLLLLSWLLAFARLAKRRTAELGAQASDAHAGS